MGLDVTWTVASTAQRHGSDRCAQVRRIMSDDGYYERLLADYHSRALPPPPGAHLETTPAYHCQWHDLRLDERPRRRTQFPVCSECEGMEARRLTAWNRQPMPAPRVGWRREAHRNAAAMSVR